MPLPRKYQIPEDQPGFYHCTSRCVRRSFLCGFDRYSGCSFEHRRQWVIDRMTFLSQCFAIDIYAYAIMSNHYHLVLFVDPHRVDTWDDIEIIQRWRRLFRGASLTPSPATLLQWRQRLTSVSWLMRCLNEPIARRANGEDQCTGHFWEKRFQSMALLDEPAILACMTYVDLNPIRAGISESLEQSSYTSIQQRINQLNESRSAQETPSAKSSEKATSQSRQVQLDAGLIEPVLGWDKKRLSITTASYLELVEWTAYPESVTATDTPEIFNTLNINTTGWTSTVHQFRKTFGVMAGSLIAMEDFIQRTGRKRRPHKHQVPLYAKAVKPPG